MNRKMKTIFYFLTMMVLIFEAKTVSKGAWDGIQLCISTLIPSLFPFVILSTHILSSLPGMHIPFQNKIASLLRIPERSVSLFVIGLLGGYPTGVQCICQAVEDKWLSKPDAQRMLCFCSNAGPSFIFGIGTALFDNPLHCIAIWIIQILSAIIVGILTPGESFNNNFSPLSSSVSVTMAIKKAIHTISIICCWVILFRILISLLNRWILYLLPEEFQCLVIGILELANGSCMINNLNSLPLRFMMFSSILTLGGICVTMQTISLAASSDINIAYYIAGKIAQTTVSIVLSYLFSILLFSGTIAFHPLFFVVSSLILYIYRIFIKRNVMKNKCGISHVVTV